MKFTIILTFALLLAASAAQAQTVSRTKMGKRGGSAMGSATVSPRGTWNAQGNATGPRGKSVSGTASGTYSQGTISGAGSITGPNGETSTFSGTATNKGNGTASVSGTVTGPKGKSKSGARTLGGRR